MNKGEIRSIWLARNFSLVGTSVFGFAPILTFSENELFKFYSIILILSWVSAATLNCESLGNIKFAKRSKLYVNTGTYFVIIIFNSIIALITILSLYHDTTEVLSVSAVAIISNIKLIILSYFRAYDFKKAKILMILDGIFHIIASVLILTYQYFTIPLYVLFLLAKCTPVIIVLPNAFAYFARKHINLQFRFLKYVYMNSFKMFATTIVTVHGITFLKTLIMSSSSEAFFISTSIALSITSNIQKFILSYYWTIQKNVLSRANELKIGRSYLLSLLKNILLSIIFIYLGIFVILQLNSNLSFSADILIICGLITAHRIGYAGLKIFVYQALEIGQIFNIQIVSLGIILVLYYTMMNVMKTDLILFIFVVFIVDIFINCICALWYSRIPKNKREKL